MTLLLVLLLAACGGEGGSPAPLTDGPTTLAYALTECRENRVDGFSGRQALLVQHRGGDPVTVWQYGHFDSPSPPVGGLCRLWGLGCFGDGSAQVGAVQRLGVSRDGSTVVFEVTDDFSSLNPNILPPSEEGFYVVRADGTGLRRLAPASRARTFVPLKAQQFNALSLSPNGRVVTFTDLDDAVPAGGALQVFTLDLATGRRLQLTHLPAATTTAGSIWEFSLHPSFLDDRTVAFVSFANPRTEKHPDGANPTGVETVFTVTTEVTGASDPQFPDAERELERIPMIAPPGGTGFIPDFTITSAEPTARGVALGSRVAENFAPYGELRFVREIFLFDIGSAGRPEVLQLTDFGRHDTTWASLTRDFGRVLFLASADLGDNPEHHCEVFSIDRLGRDLRQLTYMGEGPGRNCESFEFRTGCSSILTRVDPMTDWVTFYSSCDPFGTTPYGGQIFTMRVDGSGLRQATTARGLTTEPDGTVTVELPGPWAVSTRKF